jgi:hypothetical protein
VTLVDVLGLALRRLGRGARRVPWAIAVAALLVVTTVVTVEHAARKPAGDPTVGTVARVGVEQGTSITAYVAEAKARVAGADQGESFALVTFVSYVAPAALEPLLAGSAVAQVFARVPIADTQTQLVRLPATRLPDDVIAGMESTASRLSREAADFGQLLATTTDSQRRTEYETGARIATAEAVAYRQRCECVYAAVVRATGLELRTLEGRSGIRAVDPAPEVRRLDRAVFLPPLPEQNGLAGPP